MFRIQDVIKLLTKIFVKQNKRFPKGLEGVDIRIKAKEIHDVGKRQGYQGNISEDQLKQFLAFEKQQKEAPYRVIAGDSPEGKIISDKLTGKNVLQFPEGGVDKVPVTQQFTGQSFTADDHIKFIKSKDPIESMKEANSVIGRKGRYKNITHEDADRILKDTEDHIFQRDVPMDPQDFEGGGIAGMLGEPTRRIGFDKGKKVDLSKRKFLKGAGAGLGVLSMLPFVGKFFKGAKALRSVKAPLTHAANIEAGTRGMPVWFPKLVNRVVDEGTDVTKKLGTKEREIVHHAKVNEFEDVTVYRDLDTGNVRVEYGPPEFDEAGKVIRASNDNEVIHFEYKAPEIVEDASRKAGKEIKTKSEFSAAETEPQVANWDGDIEWEGVNEVNKVEDLLRDTSDLQKYATGKKLTIKELSESMKKKKDFKNLSEDTMNQVEYIEAKHGPGPEPSDDLIEGIDYASGGIVKLLRAANKIAPGSTALGKRSKALPKKIKDKRELQELFRNFWKKSSGGRVPLAGGGITRKLLKKALAKIRNMETKLQRFKKPEDSIMDQGWKVGKYYKKHPEKGADAAAAIATGVLIGRHQQRKKKSSGGLAGMLGE